MPGAGLSMTVRNVTFAFVSVLEEVTVRDFPVQPFPPEPSFTCEASERPSGIIAQAIR
jgi:hypothetical protein